MPALSGSARDALADTDAFTRALEGARAVLPEVRLDPTAFAAYVLERAGGNAEEALELATKRGGDLYLACACMLGEKAAIETFERRHGKDLEAVGARLRFSADRTAELAQRVRIRLFVSAGERPGHIAKYRGAGGLQNWVRVVAMRTGLNLIESERQAPEPLAETLFEALPDIEDDLELTYMKETYRAELRAAFVESVESLSPRDRNLLRYALRDGLQGAELGAIYGVHRTTAGRWLSEACQSLVAAIRGSMTRRLRLSESEFDSVLRLVRSTLELLTSVDAQTPVSSS